MSLCTEPFTWSKYNLNFWWCQNVVVLSESKLQNLVFANRIPLLICSRLETNLPLPAVGYDTVVFRYDAPVSCYPLAFCCYLMCSQVAKVRCTISVHRILKILCHV